jgi:hypothetical protein
MIVENPQVTVEDEYGREVAPKFIIRGLAEMHPKPNPAPGFKAPEKIAALQNA